MTITASRQIDVMICVNDYRNGMYCGRCSGINLSDFLDLEPVVLPEPRCTLKDGSFSIHRKKFPVRGHAQWVGNWCWDSIRLDVEQAASLIAHVLSQRWREHRIWGIQMASGDAAISLSDQVNKGQETTQSDWMSALMADGEVA